MRGYDWLMLIGALCGIAGVIGILLGFFLMDLWLATAGAKVLLAGFLFALTGIVLWLFEVAMTGGGNDGW